MTRNCYNVMRKVATSDEVIDRMITKNLGNFQAIGGAATAGTGLGGLAGATAGGIGGYKLGKAIKDVWYTKLLLTALGIPIGGAIGSTAGGLIGGGLGFATNKLDYSDLQK